MSVRHDENWGSMGAASGVLAALSFVLAFVFFLVGATPWGDPSLPDIGDADSTPAYLAANLTPIRMTVLLSSLGLALFLWFLGSLWVTLKEAEGGPGRGSALALTGGIAGSILMLVGFAQIATAGLSTSAAQADNVPTLYVGSSLALAFGGGVLALFLFGVAKVVRSTHALPRWIGVLAVVVGVFALLGFLTPFFEAGVLNAATGALGRWAWTVGFVVWLGITSVWMTVRERRLMGTQAVDERAGTDEPKADEPEGEQ